MTNDDRERAIDLAAVALSAILPGAGPLAGLALGFAVRALLDSPEDPLAALAAARTGLDTAVAEAMAKKFPNG